MNVDTYGDKEYYYELKDVDGNTAGHGEFIGYFPQETLEDANEQLTDWTGVLNGDLKLYDGTDGEFYLAWDLEHFDVEVSLTYPYGHRTAESNYTDSKGHLVLVGDYIDQFGNWVFDAGTDLTKETDTDKLESIAIYREGVYTVHMTRIDYPIPIPPLENLTAYQPIDEVRTLKQIGAILTGPDYNDILRDEDGNLLPAAPGKSPNFDPEYPYYLLELDHRNNNAARMWPASILASSPTPITTRTSITRPRAEKSSFWTSVMSTTPMKTLRR